MVSIIIPNYNHAQYLAERLTSIACQTYSSFQAVILDDFSTDDSRSIIDTFVETDARFIKYYNSANSGSTFAQWNRGVSMAKGEYIWIAESDDMADPRLLQTLVEKLNADSEIVLAYCQSNRMSEQGAITGSWLHFTADLDPERLFERDFIMDGMEYIRRFLIHRNTIPNASAVLFRKSIFERVGGAPVLHRTNGDWLTWLKMLCYGKIAYVAAPLNYFRYHKQSVIAKVHQNDGGAKYREQFDSGIRKEFAKFLIQQNIYVSSSVRKINAHYIALDRGNRGLFELKNGRFLSGWRDIVSASFYPRFQSGFLKKALGII